MRSARSRAVGDGGVSKESGDHGEDGNSISGESGEHGEDSTSVSGVNGAGGVRGTTAAMSIHCLSNGPCQGCARTSPDWKGKS